MAVIARLPPPQPCPITANRHARDVADYAAELARVGKTLQNAATGDIRAYLSQSREPILG